MVPKELNDWLQVIGLFGVLGGLIFVGLQLQLDRQVALVDGIEAGASNQLYWTELVSVNSDVWVRGLAGDSLTEAEEVQFSALAQARQMIYFNRYSRSARGLSGQSPERWVVEFALELHASPGLVKWWREFQSVGDLRRERLGVDNGPWSSAVNEELSRMEGAAAAQ